MRVTRIWILKAIDLKAASRRLEVIGGGIKLDDPWLKVKKGHL